MGYPKPINLYDKTNSTNAYNVESLLNNTEKPLDFYALEVSDTITYLPSVDDSALSMELDCTESIVSGQGKQHGFYVLEVQDNITYAPHIGDLQKSASPNHPLYAFDAYSLELSPRLCFVDKLGGMALNAHQAKQPTSKQAAKTGLDVLIISITSKITYLAKRLLLLVSLAHAVYIALFLIGATAIYAYHLILHTKRLFTRVARLLDALPILLQLLVSMPNTQSDDQKILLHHITTLDSRMRAQDSKIDSLQNAIAAHRNVNIWKKNIEAQNCKIQVQGTKIDSLLKAVTAQHNALSTILAVTMESQIKTTTSATFPPASPAPNYKFSPPLQIFGGFFAGDGNNAGTGFEFTDGT